MVVFDYLMSGLDYIVGLGASVMMPIILTLFGIALGAKVGKSLRAGLTVGVGFIGLNLVIGLLAGNLGPAAQQMVIRYGLSLSIIDVGWPAAAAISFASRVGALVIPVCLAINIIMLLTRTTQTVNIDIWNFWHFAFTGSLVAILTDSVALGVVAAGLNSIIILVLADITAPGVEEYVGLPGVSLPHGFSTAFAPVAIVLNKILDLIPGINKIHISAESIQKRFGVMGEPILVGTVIGIIMGFLAGYELPATLALGVTLGAVLVLIPRMASLLMEGLIPISDAAAELIEKRFKFLGKLYIGLDSAVGIGHPTTLAVSLILVPLTLLLAVIIPGNQVLPFGDLATLPFMFVIIVPITKGDVFRTLLIGIALVSTGLLFMTNLAPLLTTAALDAGFPLPDGTSMISSVVDGAVPLTWLMIRSMEFKVVGTIAMSALALGLAVYNRIRITKEAKLLAETEGASVQG